MTARAAVAAVALAAALPAQAYVRSCVQPAGTPCFYWPSRSIAWKLNPARAASSDSCSGSDAILAAAQAGFAAWTQATRAGATSPCDELALPYAGTTSSTTIGLGSAADHIVVFRNGWCGDNPAVLADPCWTNPDGTCGNKYNCFENTGTYAGKNTIALTTVSYVPSSGKIGDADIELIDWDATGSGTTIVQAPHGWYFSCVAPTSSTAPPTCTTYGETGCVYMDLQNTLTHEVGHFVGLAHETAVPATMNPSAAPRAIDKRTLYPDDVNGVCAIYPPVKKSSGGGGCGAGGDPAALAGLLLAAVALAPRLRRRPGR